MRKDFIIDIGRLIITVSFGILLVKRLIYFPELFVKFQLIDFVSDNQLNWLFYLLGVCEASIMIGVLFITKTAIKILVDFCIVFYVIFHVSYFLMLKSSDACIECHYSLNLFHEGMKNTLVLLSILVLLYIFLIRDAPSRKSWNYFNL